MTHIAQSVRSNLLLDPSVHSFIKIQSRNRGMTKGQIVSLAVKALKREELKKDIKSFYANSEAKKEDQSLAEELFV